MGRHVWIDITSGSVQGPGEGLRSNKEADVCLQRRAWGVVWAWGQKVRSMAACQNRLDLTLWGDFGGSGRAVEREMSSSWIGLLWPGDWVDALETVNKTHESERGQRQTKEEKTTIVFARKVIQTSSQKSAACVLHSDHWCAVVATYGIYLFIKHFKKDYLTNMNSVHITWKAIDFWFLTTGHTWTCFGWSLTLRQGQAGWRCVSLIIGVSQIFSSPQRFHLGSSRKASPVWGSTAT